MKQTFTLLVAATASLGFAQMGEGPEFVLSGETAFGLIAAEPVAGGIAQKISWSDNGRYLVCTRFDIGGRAGFENFLTQKTPPMEAEQSIIAYDVEKRKATVLWKSLASKGQMLNFQWIKGTTTLAGVVTRPTPAVEGAASAMHSEVVVMDAATGSSRTVLGEGQQDFDLQFSPVGSFVLVGAPLFVQETVPSRDAGLRGHWETKYRVLSPDGRVGQPIEAAKGAFFMSWAPDGVSPLLSVYEKSGEGKYVRSTRLIDLKTGSSTLVAGEPKIYTGSTAPGRIVAGPGTGSLTVLKTTKGIQPAWLASSDGETQALIAANVSEVALSPKLTAVAYISEGAALVRPIIQVPKEVFAQARSAAERTRIMSNAKQVGLALIMYAADMDDTLPTTQSDVGALIDPYLRNREISAGFVYTFSGGLMTEIKSPAETEMGYIPGPGGRAVVYTDGHVKWVPDK